MDTGLDAYLSLKLHSPTCLPRNRHVTTLQPTSPNLKSTIEKFLEELDEAEAQAAGSGDEDGSGGGEDEPDGGRGRKRAGTAPGGAAAKKRSRGGGSGGDEVLYSKDLSSRRKARVRRWEGKLHIDIREFYQVRRTAGRRGMSELVGLPYGWWDLYDCVVRNRPKVDGRAVRRMPG